MRTPTETLEGYVVDIACLRKYPHNDLPQRARRHTRECALIGHGVESGYGLVGDDGRLVLLDPAATLRVLDVLRRDDCPQELKLQVRREKQGEDMQTTAVEVLRGLSEATLPTQLRTVPVRVYQIEDRVMLAVPLPG
jgi:hypothetical protein